MFFAAPSGDSFAVYHTGEGGETKLIEGNLSEQEAHDEARAMNEALVEVEEDLFDLPDEMLELLDRADEVAVF